MKKSPKVDRFRAWLLTLAVEGIKPIYAILFQRDKKPWPTSIESLARRPAGSLGKELEQFLTSNGFSLVPLYENHDAYHVLLGYAPEVTDEAAMQFFLLGNRKITVSVIITVLFSLLLLPEHSRKFFREFRRGARCTPIGKWELQYLLDEQASVLRALINKEKIQDSSLLF
jgi:hypothetical protein